MGSKMSDAWDTLRERYPWPANPPDAPWTEQGWCGVELQGYFERFLNDDTTLILELGAWLGLSARFMMGFAPNARIICVDHWKGSVECHSINYVREYLPNLHARFLKRMWEYRERLVPMKQTIENAIPEIAELGLMPDFIYLDGSHDTASVTQDIDGCTQHFPGVQIMGDDWRLPTVRTAVERTGRPVEHNRIAWAFTQDDKA